MRFAGYVSCVGRDGLACRLRSVLLPDGKGARRAPAPTSRRPTERIVFDKGRRRQVTPPYGGVFSILRICGHLLGLALPPLRSFAEAQDDRLLFISEDFARRRGGCSSSSRACAASARRASMTELFFISPLRRRGDFQSPAFIANETSQIALHVRGTPMRGFPATKQSTGLFCLPLLRSLLLKPFDGCGRNKVILPPVAAVILFLRDSYILRLCRKVILYPPLKLHTAQYNSRSEYNCAKRNITRRRRI